LRVTRSLTTSLAETGLTVVSGLARGVDTHALSGALSGGRAESESTAPAEAMDTLEAAVLRRISMSEHLPADLMRGENLSLSQMSTVLMRLELAGRIQRKGGRVYLRE